MRLQVGSSDCNVEEIKEFSDWILDIGDGVAGEPNDGEVDIELSDDILIRSTTDPIATIIDNTYPALIDEMSNVQFFQERAILAPTHEIFESVNEYVMSLIPGDERVYLSSDEISRDESAGEIS